MSIVGMDLDGVLYDFITPAYRELQVYHGVTMPFQEFWLSGGGLSKEFWNNFLGIESLYSASKALSEDIQTLNDLAKSNTIFYLTLRPKNCELATRQWLRREGFPQYNNLFFGQGSKREILERLKPNYYVEDRVEIIKDIKDLTTVIVKKQFYNRELWDKDFITVDSISELKEIIK